MRATPATSGSSSATVTTGAATKLSCSSTLTPVRAAAMIRFSCTKKREKKKCCEEPQFVPKLGENRGRQLVWKIFNTFGAAAVD